LAAGLGKKVAVLAVDPSSARTGGSILGDKTRMTELSRHPNAYVRPSPSRGSLGGVTRSTNEAIEIVEAAGYDTVLVETVGVGQSEIAVEDMVDMMLMIAPPGGGDELQGIKKGIVEIADLILVNKCDGALTAAANKATLDFRNALKLLRPKSDYWTPIALNISVNEKMNLDRAWKITQEFYALSLENGRLETRRRDQSVKWMLSLLDTELSYMCHDTPQVQQKLPEYSQQVSQRLATPAQAADELLHIFFKARSES
jgi:LAO/AO transport system kinase